MSTNLRHCGSSPALPSTTPHPRPQAFDAISKANAGPLFVRDGAGAYAAKLARREQRRREVDVQALEAKNERLRSDNLALQQQVNQLRQEAAQHAHQLKAMEARVDKVSKRSESLVDAIAATTLESGTATNEPAGGSTLRVEDQGVRRAQAHAKTKINWGGTNVLAFKRALHAVTAERNEALVRGQSAAKQLAVLRGTCDDLRAQVRELAFQCRFAKEQSTATLSDLAPNATRISRRRTTLAAVGSDEALAKRATAHAIGSTRPRSRGSVLAARHEPAVSLAESPHLARDAAASLDETDSLEVDDPEIDPVDTMPRLLYELYVKLGLPRQVCFDPAVPLASPGFSATADETAAQKKDPDEELAHAVKRAQTFSKSQGRHLVDLVRHIQACTTSLFHLSQYPHTLVPTQSERAVIDLFAHVSEACKTVVPGIKHVTLWVLDDRAGTMWTRSARNGNRVQISYLDEDDSGIAGHVARNAKCVVLNNCVLSEDPDYPYKPQVDHLGSTHEFAKGPEKGFSKQSLATIPIFRDKSAWPDCSPSGTPPVAPPETPSAVLQVSKSASKSTPTTHRTFSDSQVLALSLFAHASLWILENIEAMQTLRSHDHAVQAMMHYPRAIARSLDVAPNARKTEAAKCQLLRRLELQVVDTLPGARRCRIFARRPPPASDPDALSTLLWVPVANYATLMHDSWEHLARSACAANAGVAGDVLHSAVAARLQDPYNDPRFNANIDLETNGLALIVAPIYTIPVGGTESALWGVIQVSLPWAPFAAPSVVDTVVTDLVPQIALAIALSQIDAASA